MGQYNSKYKGSEIDELLDSVPNKQATLVSGTNIKTINGQSILGAGNIEIQGGGGGGTSNYNDLTNKPSINGNELSGAKTSSQLGLASESHTHGAGEVSYNESSSYNEGTVGHQLTELALAIAEGNYTKAEVDAIVSNIESRIDSIELVQAAALCDINSRLEKVESNNVE